MAWVRRVLPAPGGPVISTSWTILTAARLEHSSASWCGFEVGICAASLDPPCWVSTRLVVWSGCKEVELERVLCLG
jgi:hypothetical protein